MKHVCHVLTIQLCVGLLCVGVVQAEEKASKVKFRRAKVGWAGTHRRWCGSN